MGGSKAPAPTPAPVPSADPATVQAQFEAGKDDDEKSALQKKKAGKSALTVKRKTTGGTNVAGTGAGLTVTGA